MIKKQAFILANFGGPRFKEEIKPFLISLLTDRDVIRTNLPNFFHRLLFTWVAKKRVKIILKEYLQMGGKSPIFEETEDLAKKIALDLPGPLFVFHRYLEGTHAEFVKKISALDVDEIRVLPLFPQFTYATTGSIARFFQNYLPWEIVTKLRWIRSYPDHPSFITPSQIQIQKLLEEKQLKAEETFFLFSAHGIPAQYVSSGDLYLDECRASVSAVMKEFPQSSYLLAFQSQFGKEEWLRPYTKDLVNDVAPWIEKKNKLIFIPISFTSDHIETLQEIGHGYLPEVLKQGIEAHLVPAVGSNPQWVESCKTLFLSKSLTNNHMLIRPLGCKSLCLGCQKLCRK